MTSSNRRYSHHARRALTHARLLVTRLRHPRMDTGHLLVGVLLTKGSIGCNILIEMGLEAAQAESTLAALTLPLDNPVETPPHDAALDAALELSADESLWLGHHYIGTEHFLLGVTRTNVGNAVDLLNHIGVKSAQVRRQVRRALQEGVSEYSLQLARRDAQLSELSRRVINAAEQMAVAMDHPIVGAGHLLAVMLTERRSLTYGILKEHALEETTLRDLLLGQSPLALLPVETVMSHAHEAAENLGSHYTGTEHLLLAMAGDETGAPLLKACGLNPEALRTLLEDKLHNFP